MSKQHVPPQRRYPRELRRRAVRMVGEVIAENGRRRHGVITRVAIQLGSAARCCALGSSKLRSGGRRPGLTADGRRRPTLLFGWECALGRLSSDRSGQMMAARAKRRFRPK